MFLIKMAIRNLWRHKSKTIVMGGALASAVMLLFLFESLEDGSHEKITEVDLRIFSGHAVIKAKDYEISRDPSLLIHGWQKYMLIIKNTISGSVVIPVLETAATLRTSEGSVILEYLFGVDPILGRKERLIPKRILKGDYLSGEKGEIVIGVKAAKTLGVDVGDKVILSLSSQGERIDEMFKVKGIFSVGGENDSRIGVINLFQLQSLLRVKDGISKLTIFKNLKDSKEIVKKLQNKINIKGAEILPWEKDEELLAQILWLDSVSGYVFLIIIFAIIEASILNSVLMNIMERRREIGVLMAIGMKSRLIFWEIMLETSILAVVGVVIGTLLFLPFYWYLFTYGIDIQSIAGGPSVEVGQVAMTGKIFAKMYFMRGVWSSVLIILLTMMSALYPAWSVIRLKLVDAINKG